MSILADDGDGGESEASAGAFGESSGPRDLLLVILLVLMAGFG
ncbi:hypothetical protein [Luteolibacter sp. AS25]